MTREQVMNLQQDPDRSRVLVDQLVLTSLTAPKEPAHRAIELLGALAPDPPPPALLEGLLTARGAVRHMLICHVVLETGPAGRDAVASLASQPGRRGRMAVEAMQLAMSRGPVRAAIAARLRSLLENPTLLPRRRRAVARALMEGGWTSAHPAIRRAAEGDAAWQRSFYYPDRLSAWMSPDSTDMSWLGRFPPAALLAAHRRAAEPRESGAALAWFALGPEQFARQASPEEVAQALANLRGPGLLALGRALHSQGRHAPELWWDVLSRTYAIRFDDLEFAELLRAAGRQLPEPDRSTFLSEIAWMPQAVDPELPDRCDELERPLALLILEGLRRLRTGECQDDPVVEDTLKDWAAELPSRVPHAPDGRAAWAEEVRSRSRMLEEALTGGYLSAG